MTLPDNHLSRRLFLTALGAVGASTMFSPSGVSRAAGSPGTPEDVVTTYVGSLSSTGGHGLDVARLDTATGALTPASLVEGVPDASFLAFSPDGKFLYTTNELAQGKVTALDVSAPDSPRVLNQQSTRGAGPTHLSVHPSGRFLLTANYTDGSVVVHRLESDGSIGASTDLVQHTGSGREPLAHQVITSPDGERVIAVDLGADSVYAYSLNGDSGVLTEEQRLALPAGTGPRHLTFHPGGAHAYVVAELHSTVTVLAWNEGKFSPGQVIGTRPDNAGGENFPAELAMSRDGRYLYASNRGDNTIATFAVHEQGAALEFLGVVPTGGNWPRHIILSPDETALHVANQKSGTITRLPRDPESGSLSPSTGSSDFPAVAMLTFHP